MNRAEHLQWAKDRAIEILETGDVNGAYVSISSDLLKHDETSNHPAVGLGMQLLLAGHLSTEVQMRNFIEGFL